MTIVKNKKIINATPVLSNGQTYKSKLEEWTHKRLKVEGFDAKYEELKYVLSEATELEKVQFYKVAKDRKSLKKILTKSSGLLKALTYTPDFTFLYKGYLVIYDVKGFHNDTYPIKRKLFLKYLEEQSEHKKIIFFEPSNHSEVEQSIEVLHNLKEDE